MDTPSPILSYAPAGTHVLTADNRIVLPQPPVAWEIVLLALSLLMIGVGAIFAAGTILNTWASPYQYDRFIGGILMLLLTVMLGVLFLQKLVRRKRYGHLPCTIWREEDVLFIDYPVWWGTVPRRFKRDNFTLAEYRRRGWALNLRPLYVMVLHQGYHVSPIKLPFTTVDDDDASRLVTRMTGLMR